MSLTSNNCPDCGSLIGKSAFKCRCGWKAANASNVVAMHIDCCHVGCGTNAFVRLKTDTGWGNFCREHYIRYWEQQLAQPRETAYKFVNQHCEEVRQRFAKSRYARLALEVGPEAAKREVMREPGDDREELPA